MKPDALTRRRVLTALLLLPAVTALPAQAAAARKDPAPTTSAALALPLVRQTYNNCGGASLSMILAYWGVQATQAQISPQVRPSPTAYMPVSTIAPFAAQYGLHTTIARRATINTVRALLAGGLPVLLLTDLTTPGEVPHWRVATGFQDAARALIIHDPLLGYITMTYSDVQRLWDRHDHLLVVLYPPPMQAAVNRNVVIS